MVGAVAVQYYNVGATRRTIPSPAASGPARRGAHVDIRGVGVSPECGVDTPSPRDRESHHAPSRGRPHLVKCGFPYQLDWSAFDGASCAIEHTDAERHRVAHRHTRGTRGDLESSDRWCHDDFSLQDGVERSMGRHRVHGGVHSRRTNYEPTRTHGDEHHRSIMSVVARAEGLGCSQRAQPGDRRIAQRPPSPVMWLRERVVVRGTQIDVTVVVLDAQLG
jgi:hypothetical protein